MEDIFDAPQQTPASSDLVQELREDCQEAIELAEAIEQHEAAIKAMKSRLHYVRTEKIPDSMSQAGIGDVFSLDSGHTIKLSQFVSGSLPKDDVRKKRAIESLAGIGGSSLIRMTVSVDFNLGHAETAWLLHNRLLQDSSIPEDCVSISEKVHPATLQAFAREKLKHGEEIPLQELGLIAGTIAKISAPKAS